MPELVIDSRFRGPATSGNGGYSCGAIAAFTGGAPAEVTLRLPPPLERPLTVSETDEGIDVHDGVALVAEARPVHVELEPPRAVGIAEARTAEARYSGDQEHPFPECFVCGPARAPGDALVLRPGPVDSEQLVASVWSPDPSLADEHGLVRPEFVWSALDCPGAFAVELLGRGTRVLGRLAVRIDERPRAGEQYVVIGWPLGGEGRRQEAGTAVLDAGGRVLAAGRAVWIEPRLSA
jgi:hypothetical protein